jgi:hypothetical protein
MNYVYNNQLDALLILNNLMFVPCITVDRVAQSVWRLATGWTVRGSKPSRGEIVRTRPDLPWGPPSLLYNRYQVLAGGKAAGAPPTPYLRRGRE